MRGAVQAGEENGRDRSREVVEPKAARGHELLIWG